MKLGLGLSIPGVATMGGNQADKAYSLAKFALNLERGGLADLSTSGFGVVNGAPPNDVDVTAGSHITTDGNDWVTVDTTDALFQPQLWPGQGSTAVRTFLCAYRVPTAPSGTRVLVGIKGGTGAVSAGWDFAITSAGQLTHRVGDGVSQSRTSVVAGHADGNWHTAAMVLNAVTGAIIYYADGVAVVTTTNAVFGGSTVSGHKPRIFDYAASVSVLWPNGIEFRAFYAWDTALPVGQIAAIHSDLVA